MAIANMSYYYHKAYYDCFADDHVRHNLENNKVTLPFDVQNKTISNYIKPTNIEMPILNSTVLQKDQISASFIMKTCYPGLLVGIGSPHKVGAKSESALGFTFDYVTGLPYLPGSAVKGTLRSAFNTPGYIKSCLNGLLKNVTDTDIRNLKWEIFGEDQGTDYKSSTRMRDVFFDAIIFWGNRETKILDIDTITPHRQNKLMKELAEPNPINFIKIRPNIQFMFCFALTNSRVLPAVTTDVKKQLFVEILSDIGIGAKTNVGYGILEAV